MRFKIILTALGISALTACATTESNTSKALLNPEAGVLCDQYVCVDKNGVSQSLTEKYLHKSRAETLEAFGEFDVTAMTFANGIFCDTSTQKCHVDRFFEADGQRSAVSQEYTEKLFGKTQ